ncbi:hypothetical protein ABZ801_30775 [Actinomadura sp. NPDC047616]|uniref:hypothetical protein n=1 Tax=Actinomadura sp. NPDC047616 TaxID=3155914 RepID=UPI00340023FB
MLRLIADGKSTEAVVQARRDTGLSIKQARSTSKRCRQAASSCTSRAFEHALTDSGLRLLRKARRGEPARAGTELFKPLRPTIQSINQTFNGQLDLERHGGRAPTGVIVRVSVRILAHTAAIWQNDNTGQPTARSLTASALGVVDESGDVVPGYVGLLQSVAWLRLDGGSPGLGLGDPSGDEVGPLSSARASTAAR